MVVVVLALAAVGYAGRLLGAPRPWAASLGGCAALVLLGVGSWARLDERRPRRRALGLGAAIGMLALAALAAFSVLLGVSPSWMSHASAFETALLGGALLALYLRPPSSHRWAAGAAGLALISSIFAFALSLVGAAPAHGLSVLTTMSVPVAVGCMAGAFGILSAATARGPVSLLGDERLAGRFARRVLPVATLLPLALAGLYVLARDVAHFDSATGLASMAIANVAAFGGLVWLAARWLARTDALRAEASDEVTLLARIVEASDDAIVGLDLEGRVTSWNRGAVTMFGRGAGEMLGQPITRLTPAARAHEDAELLARARAGEGVRHVATRRSRADGDELDVLVSVSPLHDRGGRVIGASWVARDIHAERAAEAALRASEHRQRVLTESLPQLVWTCDGVGACDYLGPQWLAYTGIPEADQLGYGWLAQLHPDDRARAAATWAEAVRDGHVFDIAFRIRRHDGVHRWFKTRAVPLRDALGAITKWFGTNTDIQELHDTNAELARLNAELEARVAARTAEVERTSASLRVVAEQLESAQRIARVGSWEHEIATGQLTWTPALYEIVGLDPSEPPPRFPEHRRLFAPSDWPRLDAARVHSLATGEGYELELEVHRPDGEKRWAIARAATRRDASGNVTHLVGTLHDVSALQSARRELARVSERVALITSALPIGIWDWDIVANDLLWDDGMYRLYDVEPSQFVRAYVGWRDAVHPDDRLVAEQEAARALAGEGDFDTGFRVVTRDGRIRHLRALAIVHRDAEGKPLRMLGINFDVTTLRETELALRSSEAVLLQFVRHAPACIAMLDTEMRYVLVSERWLADYRIEGDIIGKSHYDVFPDQPQRWRAIHERVLAGSVERCDEDPFPRADGTLEWLQWEARPWRRGDDTIGGVIFFTQHVTARKRMELELQRQKGELERTNRDLEQFAYVASHDLQEPLRAVAGCGELLRRRVEGQLDATSAELVEHMVQGAQRMQTLIRDLLVFSRVGRQGLRLERTELATLVAAALDQLQIAIAESGARVEVGALPTVACDRAQLTQVLQNLVGNALKYRGAEPPVVTIDARRVAAQWEISVRDNGIGIEARYFERIFVIFQRLHTRAEYPGTGIGLALCKRIVEAHGGHIWVESHPGAGSTFYFTLPDGG